MNVHKLVCPYCTYSENSLNAEKCELCGTPFKKNSGIKPQSSPKSANISNVYVNPDSNPRENLPKDQKKKLLFNSNT